jgi:hypothetical protein
MDATSLVLLSVLSLFDVTNAGELEKYHGIISHSKKFSLLLHRYVYSTISWLPQGSKTFGRIRIRNSRLWIRIRNWS